MLPQYNIFILEINKSNTLLLHNIRWNAKRWLFAKVINNIVAILLGDDNIQTKMAWSEISPLIASVEG